MDSRICSFSFSPILSFFLFVFGGFFFGFEDEDEISPHDRGPLMFHSVAERLDTLMLVLLTFIKDMSHVNGESLA